MRRFLQHLALTALALIVSVAAKAAVTAQSGWFEAAYAKWEAVNGASGYQVFIKPQGGTYTQLDEELVRQYPGYFRADAVGLKAGSYVMKIVPVIGGKADESKAMETSALNVIAHDRNGFAHYNRTEGVGAYNNDGTLKSNARVIYVTANNAKTVSLPVLTGKSETTCVGLQTIIAAYEKGLETRPLDVRIIGTIKKADMDALGSGSEGLQVKGKNSSYQANITIEGIGNDGAIHGFGILCRSISSVEFRNFAIMLCMDDCLSLDTDNKNIWIHNMDFFYGGTGGDADQAKGDGTVDIKGKSSHVTVSYNHFFDSGKCSLGGMKSETTDCWMTYHHNWFDHSDSRHPRIRTAFYHVYNNYYDGVSKYGVGVTCGGSSFVENNYFRNCKYPLLISKQGTDAEGNGTFSGEPGGVNKAFNNFIKGERKIQYYDGSQTDGKWDAVLAQNRDEAVSATAFSGGTSYNNTADAEARKAVPASAVEAPEAARATIQKLAGRCEQGDFKWTFNNSTQDENYGVITDLKNAIINYKSTLIGFADGSEISNGGASSTVDGGDGKGIDPDVNDSYVPSYGGGGGGTITSGEYVIGSSSDYFWTIADNADATKALIADGTITLDAGSQFQTTKNIAGGDGTVYSDKVGSLQLAKSTGTATFYWADGIQSLSLYLVRTGSFAGEIQTSDDGTSFTKLQTYDGTKGIKELTVTPATPCKYIRITNTTTGGLNIQGIKIAKPGEGGGDSGGDDPIGDERSKDATASFTLDGEDIVTAGSYTRNVAFDATETEYTVVVTPAEKASIKSVTGATEKAANTYSIAAPAAGKTATATFTIVAENETTTKTYTFNIVKGSDPATLPQEEICYFIQSTKSPSMPNVVVTGNYSNSKGSVTYNGTTYTDCVKMESSTSIKVTPAFDCNVILKFGEAGKRFNLDGTTQTTDAEGSYTFEGKQGTTYTITKVDAINLYLVIFQKAGGTTDPDPVDPDPTPEATQINFPVSTDGITASGTTTMSATEITFANGFFSKGATEAENKYDNGIIMKVEGGFKAGDVVTVAGTINVKTSDAKYDTKILTTVMLAKATAGIKAETVEEEIYTFQPFANTAEGKTATDQTYTLTKDYDELWLVRSGGTKAIVTKLIVTRSAGTGISDIETIVLDTEAMYDISGRKIAAPVKGQLYIKGGKKYIGE